MNFKILATCSILGMAMVAGTGCETTPKTEEAKSNLHADAMAAMTRFKNNDSSLNDLLKKSNGYAILPDIGKGGFIVGGAYGKGEVYAGDKMVGNCDLKQGTIGLQAGAQSYSELIVFLTEAEFTKFTKNQFAFSANASAIAAKAGAAANADHSKGVVVFVETKGGLMAEASLGGQKFEYVPMK